MELDSYISQESRTTWPSLETWNKAKNAYLFILIVHSQKINKKRKQGRKIEGKKVKERKNESMEGRKKERQKIKEENSTLMNIF